MTAVANMEVVVIVHVAQTTTSDKTRLGIIKVSKRKLTTHENSDCLQTDCAQMFKFNCPKLPAALFNIRHVSVSIERVNTTTRTILNTKKKALKR